MTRADCLYSIICSLPSLGIYYLRSVFQVTVSWLQRGSDELLPEASMVSNGAAAVMSPIQTEINNEAKKVTFPLP